MQHALALAKAARGHVWPNPPVGCVLIKKGVFLAEATTHPGGRPHAERAAIEQAAAKSGMSTEGATLYVTLEPCCHWGKTPPCTDAIIASRVRRVVCAIQDPDPRVNGGGFERLRNAGIEVSVGLCASQATRVMSGFFHRVRTGRAELLILEHESTPIPDGVDALLFTADGALSLCSRAPKGVKTTRIAQGTASDLLAGLADMGLTTVAVCADDPVAKELGAITNIRADRGAA
ncbi:bifunctional diaminohydroxyphosphoribosylaminopyrimidine deaminase/5-amino-6-(5-phosphoribosylamino)uracil reductase RibD [Roseovarius sp. MMSF_3281]|uniref:bifunctional diaminohydroxyphosphoribosylaminopyrimidine deaminase/5-amino-6-(5-phosphoribosylamino)uracil reductase RibD n=1 Tax=Roseovarius sp. MMSF_3281 TaxID=3046694 RepID=UPI00273D3406|nr:bifunctional diaminohydroxyphosphoribosylaminopyrimidine deaminase/5-amino-6-(5-phosphoribosylamino)uracil reductase RibD [Roseovarius sp. MMSF_3281]